MTIKEINNPFQTFVSASLQQSFTASQTRLLIHRKPLPIVNHRIRGFDCGGDRVIQSGVPDGALGGVKRLTYRDGHQSGRPFPLQTELMVFNLPDR